MDILVGMACTIRFFVVGKASLSDVSLMDIAMCLLPLVQAVNGDRTLGGNR